MQVQKGDTAAVFGLGTIGLACVDALHTVGAKRIIGVDTDPGKFARAKEWGATDLINPKDHDKPIQVLLWQFRSPCHSAAVSSSDNSRCCCGTRLFHLQLPDCFHLRLPKDGERKQATSP